MPERHGHGQRRRWACVQSTLFIALLILLGGCMGSNPQSGTPGPPPTLFVNPPIYPGARNIGEHEAPSGELKPSKFVTFETSDRADKVLSYYRLVLQENGWRESDNVPPNVIWFDYVEDHQYVFEVTARDSPSGGTSMQIRLTEVWGR